MALSIVPMYAAFLALAYVVLAGRVVAQRRSAHVSLGSGGDKDLERRIRVHGNFAEYVPLALILIAFVEMQGAPAWSVHLLSLVLIAARAAHAYGLSTGTLRLRVLGVTGTFAVLISASLSLLRPVLGF